MDFLFIAASFFGYSQEIKAALEARGRSVLWFEDRPDTSNRTKALLRVMPSLVKRKADEYFDRVIDQAREHDIRDVLIIKGEALSPEKIRKMRQALPRARFTLYFWDGYRNMPVDAPQKVSLFDRALSFDPLDVEQDSRLAYRPLFYLNEYAQLPSTGQDIDLLFIGTSHSDRYAVLSKLARTLPPELRFECVLFLASPKLFYARKLADSSYWRAHRDEFVFKSLSKAEVMSMIGRARVIVDVERRAQTGYTMRTIEMLGGSRKLITTNPRITAADFYCPENQIFIERNNPVVPERFFQTSWQPQKPDLLARYSLDGWLDEVLARS